MHKPQDILRSVWGYDGFRPLQGEIIASVLVGRDTLALLPTGGGKSLCYQVPALSLDGVTLVVSPLIALMKDQVSALRKRNVAAAAIFSGLRPREIEARLDSAAAGQTRLLYLSPERLASKAFLGRLQRMPVGLVAIDEAHCIAEWGHDFRPAYLRIAELRERLPGVPFLALTASATPRVQEEIAERLQLSDPARYVGSFARDNLVLGLRMADNKGQRMLELFGRVSGSALVYLRSRRKVEQWAEWLRRQGVSAEAYHAGLPPELRAERQEAWMAGKIRVMVCTTAFGMGIDKGDVRLVLHLDAPESLEAYYQEAGRAGRDGKRSWAAMFLDAGDRRSLADRLNAGPPDVQTLRRLYQQLADHCQLAIGAGEGEAYAFDPRTFARKIGLPPRAVTESLRILEQEGFLALNEAAWLPARAWMKAGKADLYRFQVEHRHFDGLVKALLRSTPGIFDHHAAIDEGRLARQLDSKQQVVREGLSKLAEYRLLDYLPRSETPQLVWLRPREDARYLRVDRQALERRRERHRKRLLAVLDYLDMGLSDRQADRQTDRQADASAPGLPDCRMARLQGYFGEQAAECGRCDRCLARRHAEADPAEAVLAFLKGQSPARVAEVVAALRPMPEQEAVQALRWLIDGGRVRREADDRVSFRP